MTEDDKLRFVSSRIRRDVTSKLCNLLNPNFVQSGVLKFELGFESRKKRACFVSFVEGGPSMESEI